MEKSANKFRNKLDQLFEQKYQNLNAAQKEAVNTIYGPVLVLAGPGTGKTELLSIRVANILKKTDASASSILCLTFTEAGAEEMRERIIKLVGKEGYKVCVATFHAFALQIVEKYPQYFPEGEIKNISTVQSLEILEKIFDEFPHDHIFTKKFKGEYFLLKDTLSRISDLKREGFLGTEFRKKLQELELEWKTITEIYQKYSDLFEQRLNLKLIPEFEKLQKDLEDLEKVNQSANNSFSYKAAEFLKISLQKTELVGKTEFLKDWKNKFVQKDESGKYVFADQLKLEQLYVLAEIYEKYVAKIQEEGLRDYDDMILNLVQALLQNKNLVRDLEEEYQFILVDEFQDTNQSQFRILQELTQSEFQEGQPNILCVGDSDQTIFKFQGANSNNLGLFRKSYQNFKEIILTENYRSTQNLLDFSRQIILQAENDLENKNLNKILKSSNKKVGTGQIEIIKCLDDITEYTFIAKEIKKLLEKNILAQEIAVISKKHSNLIALKDFLIQQKINFSHSQQVNILEISPVQELILLMKYIAQVLVKPQEVECLLPEILSADYLEINSKEILQISLQAQRENKSWLEIMLASENLKIKYLAYFLLELSKKSKICDFKEILDILIGNKSLDLEKINYVSNFKNYYFANSDQKHYFLFLESLKKLIEEINIYFTKDFKSGKKVSVKRILEFLEIYQQKEIIISVEKPSVNKNQGVNLLTAHAAKGLEFQYVFLIGTDDKTWKTGKRNNVSFPVTLPVVQKNDNDDILRLLYVAVTRAKTHLMISYHKNQKLEFLENLEIPEKEVSENVIFENQNKLKEKSLLEEMEIDKNQYVQDLTKYYQLSVSVLNSFLDIYNSGPEEYFKNNILKFPVADLGPAVKYGNAMHNSINYAYQYSQNNNKIITLKDLLKKFTANNFDLDNTEERRNHEKGLISLERYYQVLKKEFLEMQKNNSNNKFEIKSEINFKKRNIIIGQNIEITGMIDKIIIRGRDLFIYDFKTGGTIEDFEKERNYKALQAHHYKYQLAFYKLLLQNDREFRDYNLAGFYLHFLDEKDTTKSSLELEIDEKLLVRVEKLAIIIFNLIKTINYQVGENFLQLGAENISVPKIIEFEDFLLEKFQKYLN